MVIGHGGASAVAPANTLRSFDMALDASADVIEFDVRCNRGRLELAHGILPSVLGTRLELATALDHLAGPAFARVGLNVDVKAPGYERATLDLLREHGLLERTLVSSQCLAVIDRCRAIDPGLATAISIAGPWLWRARSRSLRTWRPALLRALRSGRFGDVMLQHELVDAEIMAACDRTGRRVFAWTVDDPARSAVLAALGVAGVVTGNPRALTS